MQIKATTAGLAPTNVAPISLALISLALISLALISLGACGDQAKLTQSSGYGAAPELPAPPPTLIPTLNIAPAVRWREGGTPTVAQVAAGDLQVTRFAENLDHPRWLYVLPNGDVLVAESNAPPKPEDSKGIRGWVQHLAMRAAGAVTESANRITLLRSTRHNGIADLRMVFLSGLHSPIGMALVGRDFYVADSNALLRFTYAAGATAIRTPATKLLDLPAGPINHHWTKNVIASADGSRLYVTIGSNSNVLENGVAAEAGRADIWQINPADGTHRVFAAGLRNPNGMGWSSTGKLWVAVNERDEIGSDLVPDYMTAVVDGGFYGWPYSYYGQHVDDRAKPPRPDLVAAAIPPDYALGAHTASLGLAFHTGPGLTAAFAEGAFIGQHGSWNRNPLSGYKVIFVPFRNGAPSGAPVDILTGFLDPYGRAQGRPVGLAIDPQGALLVADDVGNMVWRVSAR